MEMQLEPMGAELRFSRVAPDLENNLSKVSELVQLMRSGGAGLTDTQATRLVGYLGSLEDMRSQIGVIAQRYEDDDNVLRKLTMLLDRIDESLRIIHYNNEGYSKEDISDQEKEEEVVVEKALHNSLMVSTTHVLGISGLLLPRLFEDLAVHAEEVDDNEDGEFWDPPLTEADIACLDITSNTNTQVPLNLSASFMESDPSEVPSPTNLRASNTASESSSSNEKKGKEKMKGACPPTLCKICYEEFTNWDDLYSLSNCNHTYCKECFTEYLSLQIISGGVLDLSCPNPQCEKEVTITDVHAVCDDETLEKYERFVVLAALRADPDVRWCPVPQCSNPIRGPPTDGSEWVVCSKCQLQVCFACGDERHDPVKCGKEAKELIATRHHAVVEAESAFEEWHKGKPTDVKPCPKCKAFIEKNQGCNHMTCVACKHQFCWLCKADYVYNHFNSDLYPDCKGKQYWYPPVPPDPELQSRYNWIYFPPNYQYEGIEAGPLTPIERIGGRRPRGYSNSEKAGKIAKKVGVYVGVGMAVATLGIPAAIIGGPIYGVFKLHKRLKAKRAYNRRFRQDHPELYI